MEGLDKIDGEGVQVDAISDDHQRCAPGKSKEKFEKIGKEIGVSSVSAVKITKKISKALDFFVGTKRKVKANRFYRFFGRGADGVEESGESPGDGLLPVAFSKVEAKFSGNSELCEPHGNFVCESGFSGAGSAEDGSEVGLCVSIGPSGLLPETVEGVLAAGEGRGAEIEEAQSEVVEPLKHPGFSCTLPGVGKGRGGMSDQGFGRRWTCGVELYLGGGTELYLGGQIERAGKGFSQGKGDHFVEVASGQRCQSEGLGDGA